MGCYPVRDVLGYELVDAIAVGPGDVPELVVERLDDVRQPIELGFRLATAARRRQRFDGRVRIRQLDSHRGLLLHAVAVHVDGFENAFRKVLVDRCGELGDQEVQEDRELLPVCVCVRQNRRQEAIGPHERLALTLEVDLPVLIVCSSGSS